MNDPTGDPSGDLERLLAEAFHARARADVPDHAPVPAPRFADATPGTTVHPLERDGGHSRQGRHSRPDRRSRWVAPLAAAAAVVLVGAGAVVLAERSGDGPTPVAAPGSTAASTAPGTPTASSADSGQNASGYVRVTTLNSDDITYGVGMPVIAYFSKRITDARAFQAATRATANGAPLEVAWYFQRSAAGRGPIEGQLRPRKYWPANATIRVSFPPAGTALGSGMSSDGKLRSLMFRTGPRQIATVNDRTHELTLTVDGRTTLTVPVALGATRTPTRNGIKVVMEQTNGVTLSGPGFKKVNVQDAQRLTYDGEYLHAAPWNVKGIDAGKDNSNGCTNLLPADAAKLYKILRVGDVVQYENVDGPAMQVAQGYGAWNMPWQEWRQGGLIPTR